MNRAFYLPFHLFFKWLLVRNFALREAGSVPDKWYWADSLCSRMGYFVNGKRFRYRRARDTGNWALPFSVQYNPANSPCRYDPLGVNETLKIGVLCYNFIFVREAE